ncbi:transposase [Acidithiobacillus sp. AMEEHan]|uniref:transposase n=1 Tax=Acidithiobacillus sp. AMEEHan TaxID=2994951 RepID=UPI0035B3D8E2
MDGFADPLQKIDAVVDLSALDAAIEKIPPRPAQPKGGRPSYPTEVMVRILVIKRMYGLSDEQTEYQLLDRRSFLCFCGLEHSRYVPEFLTGPRFGTLRTGLE